MTLMSIHDSFEKVWKEGQDEPNGCYELLCLQNISTKRTNGHQIMQKQGFCVRISHLAPHIVFSLILKSKYIFFYMT